LDREVVIQDQNSQRTGEFIKSEILNLKSEISVWDCCAGSGGKSIMAFDIDPKIKLSVSDARESILANLKKRFANAGIKNYESFVIDLANKSETRNLKSEIIIADVPCSGSGTWSRTPEQLYFFEKGVIEKYSALQKKIVSNALPHLKPGGSFVYITCSVFKKENEEVVTFIKENFQLKLKQMPARMSRSDGEVLKGYDKKADTMFVALFEKEL
jgi:16S rRNA (cytosine967-C5)-methyltransferase